MASVEPDRIISIADNQSPATWGLDRIDQRTLPLSNSYQDYSEGGSVHAYVIDTGIRRAHAEFAGRMGNGFDAVTAGGGAEDCHGHGTHVAGTVGGTTYGVADKVTLHPVRVLGCNGSGSFSAIIAGVDWVTANRVRPAVANMSLGGAGASVALENAVTTSINSGITYAIAAGNSTANACSFTPARTPAAITVGATTNADARAAFSNYGACLDLFAPGQDITAAWHTSDSATNTISGTSMASPHVAGVAALYLSANQNASPATVRDAIVAAATTGRVTNPGSGSPNALLYNSVISAPAPPPPPPSCDPVTNGTDVAIPDLGTVSSPITVSGCSGNASTSTEVTVNIRHTWRGDLVVDLIAPSGTVYRLLDRVGGSADNVNQTFTLNASSSPANGTWTLRVRDTAAQDVGSIDSWTINP